MKYKWLRCDGNSRLVLLFAGWGTDASYYDGISAEGWDVLVCYDFDDYEFDTSLTSRYDTVYLYAWSLGVHAAACALRGVKNITAAFAINGTEHPCDDGRGIPSAVFLGTRDNLDMRNLTKFRKRMFASSADYAQAAERLPQSPDIEALKRQLTVASTTEVKEPALFWTRAYISASDRIFPAAAQRMAWTDHPSGCEVCEREGAHAVNIAKIVASTIPNPRLVGRKFEASVPTYDANATAQRMIASRLAAIVAGSGVAHGGRMLEIGQGTGLSTRMFAEQLTPSEIDCVDLYRTPELQLGVTARYHTGDAERWVAEAEGCWDYILSASAIQWFADLRGFIRNASLRLSENGVLACSTFAPGNLGEFDALRPSPMLYRTQECIRGWLEEFFVNVETSVEDIRVTFPTAKDALMHLRLTGVGGSSNTKLGMGPLIDAIPRDEHGRCYLTYRPLYFIAQRKRR